MPEFIHKREMTMVHDAKSRSSEEQRHRAYWGSDFE